MRFKKGNKFGIGRVPWNKGKKIPGMCGENNPVRRPEVRKKISETRKRKFKSGELKSWCKGRTKENCASLMKTSEKHKKIIKDNPELREKRRQNALRQWRDPKFKEYIISLRKGKTYEEIYGEVEGKIKRKKLSESKKGKKVWNDGLTHKKDKRILSGKKHPNWVDGRRPSIYYKNFTKRFKKTIIERDMGCLLCNLSIEDLHLLKRTVVTHHINYDKLVSCLANCCTLCNSCHSKTNFNREHWTKFFQSLLAERYGYEYLEEKEIIFTLGTY